MQFKQEIEFYGDDIKDMNASPFEMLEAFHKRSTLHHQFDQFTFEEKILLKKYDQLLLKTAKQVYEQVRKVYDFQSDKPLQEWWWHLDKVVKKQLNINLETGTVTPETFVSTVVEFQSKEAYDLFLDWSRDKQITIREKRSSDGTLY